MFGLEKASMLLSIALLCISARDVKAQIHFLPQGDTIEFDAKHHLSFEDVGRVANQGEAGTGIRFGSFIRLHVFADGKNADIDLIKDAGNKDADSNKTSVTPLIPSQVTQIRYKSAEEVWIVSRGGRRADYAILFDLSEKKLVRIYLGTSFAISPESDKIAFFYPGGMRDEPKNGIFINDTMVYPVVQADMVWREGEPPSLVSGAAFNSLASGHPTSIPAAALKWNGNDSLSFAIKENPGMHEDGKSEIVKNFVVSGLTLDNLKSSSPAITVKRAP